jgi:hypothetical protein
MSIHQARAISQGIPWDPATLVLIVTNIKLNTNSGNLSNVNLTSNVDLTSSVNLNQLVLGRCPTTPTLTNTITIIGQNGSVTTFYDKRGTAENGRFTPHTGHCGEKGDINNENGALSSLIGINALLF